MVTRMLCSLFSRVFPCVDAPKVLQRDADYALDCILTCLSAFSNMQSLNNPTAAGSAGQGAQQQMKTSANINPVQSFVSLGRRDSSVSGTMGMESAAPMMPMSSVMQGHEGFRLKTIAYHGESNSTCFVRVPAPWVYRRGVQ